MSFNGKLGVNLFERGFRKFKRMVGRFVQPVQNQVVSLRPEGMVRGHVLISYRIELFLSKFSLSNRLYHPSWLISQKMADIFLDLGFAVDVIANENREFLPKHDYDFFVDSRMNFERISPSLNKNCIKIFHVTTAHPYFHNAAEYRRLLELQERKHVTLRARRHMPPCYAMAVEYADYLTVPSEFCLQGFRYAQKPFFRVPNPSEFLYPWPESKDFGACQRRFLWLGSRGLVHKGLDLVLEAFAEMPEYHLTVCGPVTKENDFEHVYKRELYHTPNIHTIGWVDINGPDFLNIASQCVALIYPSCSEGSAGSVVTCLHAGLIPIISYESGVDVEKDFGVILNTCSIQEIKTAIHHIGGLPVAELEEKARKSWKFARANHTMENFELQYRKMVEKLIAGSGSINDPLL